MKTILALATLWLSGGLIYFSTVSTTTIEQRDQQNLDSTSNDSMNVLQDVLAMNEAWPEPATEFRAGHVTDRKIKDFVTKTETGYVIKLPFSGLTPSPTIYNGKLYVSGGFGSKEFYSFDAQTGDLVWGIGLDDDGPSSAVVEDDIAVFNTESCTIFAVDCKTGKHLWSYWLGDPLMSTPTIKDGYVYTAYPATGGGHGNYYNNNFNNNQLPQNKTSPKKETKETKEKRKNYKGSIQGTHVLACFELKTGKIAWQKWIDGDIMSAPVAEDDILYVTSFPGTIYQFDLKDGEILAATAGRATSAPIIVDGEMVMSRRSDQEKGTVMESISIMKNKGQEVREYNKKSAPYLDKKVQQSSRYKSSASHYDAANGFSAGAPANSGADRAADNIGADNVSSLQSFQGSRVYNDGQYNYNTMGDELLCTDPATGKTIWKQNLKGDIKSEGGSLATPPVVLGNKILVATLEGDVIISDKTTGKEIKRYELKEQIRFQPIADEGNIYVTTMGGKLHCIQTGDKELTAWPTWGGNMAHTNKVSNRNTK